MAAPATAPAPGGADTSPFGIKGKLNDKLSGRRWTWPLRIASLILGLAFIGCGLFGLINLTWNPVTFFGSFITALYIIGLAVVLMISVIPYPARLHNASLKWFGLLHKYRGRGFYIIFVGVLCIGTGMAGWIVGPIAVVVGLLHIVIAIYFKETLDKKSPLPHEMTPEEAAAQKKQDQKGIGLDMLF